MKTITVWAVLMAFAAPVAARPNTPRPAPTRSTAQTIRQAEALCQKAQFSKAQDLLERALSARLPRAEQRDLHLALTGVFTAWGREYEKTHGWSDAATQYVSALDHCRAARSADGTLPPFRVANALNRFAGALIAAANEEEEDGNRGGADGDYREARERLDEARGLLDKGADPRAGAESLRLLALLDQRQGNATEAADDLQQALSLAQAAQDRRLEGAVQSTWGAILAADRQYGEAAEKLQGAISIQREAGDRYGEVHTRLALGDALLASHKSDEAAQAYQDALAVLADLPNPFLEGIALCKLGDACLEAGRDQEAQARFKAAREAMDESDAPDGRYEAQATGGLGVACLRLGEAEEAQAYLAAALNKPKRPMEPRFEAMVRGALGRVELSRGDLDAAQRELEAAMQILLDRQDDRVEGETRIALGLAYQQKDRYGDAIDMVDILTHTEDSRGAEACHIAGVSSFVLGRYADAVTYLERTRPFLEASGDAPLLRLTLCDLGYSYDAVGQYEKALAAYQEALPLQAGTCEEEAATLVAMGKTCGNWGKMDEALGYYETAVTRYSDIGDRARAATTLNEMGSCLRSMRRYTEAIEKHTLALSTFDDLGYIDKGRTMNLIGRACYAAKQYPLALEAYEKALAFFQQDSADDLQGRIQTQCDRANVYLAIRDTEKADACCADAHKTLLDRREAVIWKGKTEQEAQRILGQLESAIWRAFGDVSMAQGNEEAAFASYKQSLQIQEAAGAGVRDSKGEAVTRYAMGEAYESTEQYDQAIASYMKALDALKRAPDRELRAAILGNMGTDYLVLCRYREANACYEEFRSGGYALQGLDDKARATLENNMGLTCWNLGDFENARKHFEAAWTGYEAMRGKAAGSESILGVPAWDREAPVDLAGDEASQGVATPEVLPSAETAETADARRKVERERIAEEKAARDEITRGESAVLNNLGCVADSKKEYRQAVDAYNRALAALQTLERLEKRDEQDRADILHNLGLAYCSLGEFETAKQALNAALEIQGPSATRNAAVEGRILSSLGVVYWKEALKHPANLPGERPVSLTARRWFEKALVTNREANDREGECATLHNLMCVTRDLGEADLAIFYGKMAVNERQAIRGNLRQMKRDTQQIYVYSNQDTYVTLAQILIDEERTSEAEQVLAMLKEEEYYQALDNNAEVVGRLQSRVELTELEKTWDKELNEALSQAGAASAERTRREAAKVASGDRSGEARAGFADLNATKRLLDVPFDRLSGDLKDGKLCPLPASRLQAALSKLGRGTVAVYMVIGDEWTWIVAVSPDKVASECITKSRSQISAAEVAFRTALENPSSDVLERGKELYDMFVKPIEPFLEASQARTVLWSLDGPLRYVPMAALWDGKRFLVERWSTGVFALSALDALDAPPRPGWSVLAAGVSNAREGLSELPYVPAELNAIARDGNDCGLMPGVIRLDPKFSRQRLEEDLKQRYPVVHIASHFVLDEHNMEASSIVLGTGPDLRVQDFRTDPALDLSGVDLLTLSACETALGDAGSDGREIDGFGLDLYNNGKVKSVLASLWSVEDKSTALLMREFYGRRQKDGLTKAEALREAQLALLNGTALAELPLVPAEPSSAVAAAGASPVRGASPVVPTGAEARETPIRKGAPYAHPYYWAPFVLIGNCQ